MSDEAILKMTVEIPRSTILKLREKYPGEIPQVIERAIEAAAGPDEESVRVSKQTMLALCTLLDAGAINSERDLIRSVQERFKVSPGTIMLQLDPNVTQVMEDVARSNGISTSEVVKNGFQEAIANNWFGTTWDLYSLLFTRQQWKALKLCLGKLPSDARTIVKVLLDWSQMQEAVKLNAKPQLEGTASAPVIPEPTTAVPSF